MNDQNYPPNDNQSDEVSEDETAVDLTEEDLAPEGGEVEVLRVENAELSDRILRLAAELENTRRRAEREKAEASRYAISGFARDLLSVADTFERALASAPQEDADVAPETVSALVAGLKMTDKELISVLERHGVKRVSPKGEKFDPNLHQAVAQAPGDQPVGHVLDVAQPGFTIGDRVLRAAMVVVSTGAAPKASANDGEVGDESKPADDSEAEPGSHVDTSA